MLKILIFLPLLLLSPAAGTKSITCYQTYNMATGCVVGSTCNSNDLQPSTYTTYTLNDEDPYDCYTYIVASATTPVKYTLYRGNSPKSCTTMCVETAENNGAALVYFSCYEYANGNNEDAAKIDMSVTKIGCSVMSSTTQTSATSTVSAWYLSSWQWSMAALSCLVLAVFVLACALLVILIVAVVCWRKHKNRMYVDPKA